MSRAGFGVAGRRDPAFARYWEQRTRTPRCPRPPAIAFRRGEFQRRDTPKLDIPGIHLHQFSSRGEIPEANRMVIAAGHQGATGGQHQTPMRRRELH
ncbi:MAG: hypothetical protein O2856_03010 [Planctomycetota bacterium]|nr:hypothetical protein [Planctomycetota bacterium]